MPKVSEAHSAARRQQIIDAAYRCFARKGFHQTTMREIYQEAQLSPGAVYHYFDGKDSIIQASFEFDRQRSQDVFAGAVANPDPLQALRNLVEFFFQGLESAAVLGAGRVNVQGWGEALVNPTLLASMQSGVDDYLDALTATIGSAQRKGQLDSGVDARAVGRMFLSLYFGMELQKALFPEAEVSSYRAAIEVLLLAPTTSAMPAGGEE